MAHPRPGRGLALATLLALVVPSTLSAATDEDLSDDRDKRFGEEILDILRQEGAIDPERYAELKAKEAEEARAAGSPAPDDWNISYRNVLTFERNDGRAKLAIGGRLQADFATIHVDDALESALPGGDGDGVEFRRARFYLQGELNERIFWKSQIDFSTGIVVLADAYIGIKGLGLLGTAKIGHMKEPFSLEELTSSKYITFMERSLPAVFDSARDFGVSFSNTLHDERISWTAAVLAPTGPTGFSFSQSGDFNIGARITGLPIYSDAGRALVHLGISAMYQARNATPFRFRQRPEIHLARQYFDTGPLASDGAGLLAIEFAGVCGAFHFASEWKQAWVDTTSLGNEQAYGGYISAGYFLTGEHRRYQKSNGTWSRVTPLEPFDPDKGQWGAFEIATRYSYLDVDQGSLDGGSGQNISGALNWYLLSNLRISANYVYADVKDTGVGAAASRAKGRIHAFQMRAQLEF